MAKVLVSADGQVSFGGVAVAGIQSASLYEEGSGPSGQAIGESYVEEYTTIRRFSIELTRYADSTDASGGLFALGAVVVGLYESQNPDDMFEGDMIITRISDRQQQGDFEMQSITARSTGTPTTVPATF